MASDPPVWIIGRHGQLARCLDEAAGRRGMSYRHVARPDINLDKPGEIKGRLSAALETSGTPRCIINAAAYTAVDRAETEIDTATRINGQSPGRIAKFCAQHDISLLHVSTDYVFDGDTSRAFREDDTPAPVNAYGRSKLAGETAILESGARALILRTSGVFSRHGSNFLKSVLKLAGSRESLDIVSDQITAPTPATAIAESLLDLSAGWGGKAGIVHFCGDTALSWADFARRIFDESARQGGPSSEVVEISTRAYGAPAERPRCSVLDCERMTSVFGIHRPDLQHAIRDTVRAVLRETT